MFETEEDSAGAYTGPSHPFAHVSGINRWRWPADQRDGNGVLHAKLLVIDGRRALVGSANLTSKALAHNLEVGAVINDPDLARAARGPHHTAHGGKDLPAERIAHKQPCDSSRKTARS